MSLILLLAALASLPLVVTDLVFVTEVLLGLRQSPSPSGEGLGWGMSSAKGDAAQTWSGPTPNPSPEGEGLATRIALLVPAHNEEGIVRGIVAAMRATVPPGTRLLLVAHNCTDRTAAEALAGGAEVFALDDPARRGKGYALAGGRDRLALDPPEVVVAIDADCVPDSGAVARLAETALACGRAVQSAYLFRPKPDAPAVVQVSNFAMVVKNRIRQRGAARIGAPALLTGSGMAFPWALFATLELATGNIVEDLALGVDLVRGGRPPVFEDRAVVWSDPASAEGMRTQRSRWEGGFLGTARHLGLPLLALGITRASWSRLWMGLHLLTLPLTLLLAANGALTIGWALLWLLGAPGGAAVAALALTALVTGAVLAAWAVAGRAFLPPRALVRLPLYLLWKLALYARIARGRDAPAWVRTARD